MQNETLRGKVGRVWFSNPAAPFMAGTLELESGGTVRFSGKIAATTGDPIEIVGRWTDHPKYGRQFDAETAVVRMDESPDALAHLLATHEAFKGLGPARARKVVAAALSLSSDGEAVSAMLEAPAAVAARAGVAIEIVENAAKVWGERKTFFAAMAALGEQGWSNAQATRIIAKLGEGAPSIVRGAPYSLIGLIPRFGFRTVDAVALKMGTPATSPERLQSGVAFVLDRIASNGNTWTTRAGLIDEALKELRPDTLDGEDRTRAAVEELAASEDSAGEMVADAKLAAVEFAAFDWLLQAMGEPLDAVASGAVRFDGPRATAILPTLNRGQKLAVWNLFRRRCNIVSGGAGTGKTYTMRAICEVAEECGYTVALCAPTGKAARKLSHSTQRRATTIHRLLETMFDEETGAFRFRRGASLPLEADLVVVDEVSMVDVRLMLSLLVAIPPHARVLLVGDHHQIPSVSPGAILRDLLSARTRYPESVHVLTEIVRQAGELAQHTTAILDGVVVRKTSPAWDFVRTEKGSDTGTASIVAKVVERFTRKGGALAPFGRELDPDWDVQVLSPMRKGPLGIWALNVELQKVRQQQLGQRPPEPTPEGKSPKPLEGDRVLWTVNDYELDLFNGTQAIVVRLHGNGAVDLFTEDGREVQIPAAKRINLEVAYAMTIHKAQGSEWPCVVLVASSAHWIMHDRNLLYTGSSRAAEALTIVGDLEGVSHFAREQRSAARATFGSYLVHGWQPRAALRASVFDVVDDELSG